MLGVGGAHLDRRGRVGGDHVPGASNPGAMTEDVGGGTFNALRTATLRGVATLLVSVRGGDLAGEMVGRTIARSGIADLSAVFLDRSTASYTAILDRGGELVTALADMSLYEAAFPRQMRRSSLRHAAAGADAVLCDANLPVTALDTLLAAAPGKPCHAIAISPAKVVRFEGLLDRLECLYMNRREAAALCGLTDSAEGGLAVDILRRRGLRSGVITDGSGPVIAFRDGASYTISPPLPRRVSDVTGAGDALAGASVAALLRGATFPEAVREGIAAALLTIESSKAAADFPQADFDAVLATVPLPAHAEASI